MPEPCLALLIPQGEVNSRQEEAEGDECSAWMFLPELNFCSRPCGGLSRLEEKQLAKPTHSPQENHILSFPMATEKRTSMYVHQNVGLQHHTMGLQIIQYGSEIHFIFYANEES